jgi:hypothetical protein
MNKLKKYAGLLNEEAPKDHFLAYITPSERDMLVDAGGKKTSTPSGIFAYPPDNWAPSSPSKSSSKSSGSHSRSYNPGAGGVVQHSPTKSKTTSNTGGGRDPSAQYTSTTTISPSAKQALQNQRSTLNANIAAQGGGSIGNQIKEFFQSGGLVGAAARGASNILGGVSDISKAMQAKAMQFTLNRKIKSRMGDLDLNNPNTMKDPKIVDLQKDLQGVKDGTFTQSDYTAKYGSGDATNPLDASFNPATLNDNDRQELENLFAPELTHAIGGTTPQESMVNKYFANMGSNLGISSNYTNTYNQAKANLAKSLNMTPNTQQYGYTANPYSQYPSTMTSANPFFDELTEQGLI